MFKMMYLLLDVLCCVCVFVFRVNCSLVANPVLNNFRFSPKGGECYVMYDESEIMSPFYCQRPANLERQSCIEVLAGEGKYCLSLKTPGNETIEFLCVYTKEEAHPRDSIDNTCFRVYSANNTSETICQEIFENEAVGLRTPTNVIILLMAKRCPISTSINERRAFSNFVNHFSFDSKLSCFKVYNPDQVISPDTYLHEDIQESCIDILPAYEGCVGIITPNNETVIFYCPQGNQRSDSHNCFKIYTPDNVEYTTCKKAVEERCVGIITPTNLTVLLGCYGITPSQPYDLGATHFLLFRSFQKNIKNFLEIFEDGVYSITNKYDVSRPDENDEQIDSTDACFTRRYYVVRVLPGDNNCQGITLDNSETIVLKCPNEKPEEPGCFEVHSPTHGDNNNITVPEQKKVCVKALDERCIGIITPGNRTLPLNCLPWNRPCLIVGISSGPRLPNNKHPPRI